MTAPIITFWLILVPHLLIYLPFPMMIVPTQTEYPGIPLIRFQITFILPLENILEL